MQILLYINIIRETNCGFDSHSKRNNNLMFSFPRSGNEDKRGVGFHAISPEFGGKSRSEVS